MFGRSFSNSHSDLSYGLTDAGRAQVERLAEQLAGVPFGAFYGSPVLRARLSAEILSARLGLDYVIAPALTEYDVGELEGRSDAASWQRYDEVYSRQSAGHGMALTALLRDAFPLTNTASDGLADLERVIWSPPPHGNP
jgi:broad specificity phosphatase PhoE